MARPLFRAGNLKDRIRIQRPIADSGFDGAGSGGWTLVYEVAADVQDMLPSHGERIAEGINVSSGPARIRLRYRSNISADMRLLVGRNLKDEEGAIYWHTDRIMQIVSEPAILGRRQGLELIAEEYKPAGNPA